jgi:hypothetical protein
MMCIHMLCMHTNDTYACKRYANFYCCQSRSASRRFHTSLKIREIVLSISIESARMASALLFMKFAQTISP